MAAEFRGQGGADVEEVVTVPFRLLKTCGRRRRGWPARRNDLGRHCKSETSFLQMRLIMIRSVFAVVACCLFAISLHADTLPLAQENRALAPVVVSPKASD